MAFLRVLQTQLQPGEVPAEVNAFVEAVLAREPSTPGLQFRAIGRDPESGKRWTITVWDTREQAVAGMPLSDAERQQLASFGRVRNLMEVVEIGHLFVKSAEAEAGFLRVLQTHMPPSAQVPGDLAEAIRAMEPNAPGLQFRAVGRDPTTGKGWTITVWDTHEHAVPGLGISEDQRAQLAAIGYGQDSMEVVELQHLFVKSAEATPA
jgi:hypothetical protein